MGERAYRIAVVLVVVAAIGGGVWLKARHRSEARKQAPAAAEHEPALGQSSEETAPADTRGDTQSSSPSEGTERDEALPAVIDLGMGKCIPCKMMKPILDELANQYHGRARIEIIDIGERPEEAKRWRVFTIPTQIFLDARGNEICRHEGFMPKEDIVAKLREMGVE